MHPSKVVVRPVASEVELKAVVDLTGNSFPEECGTLQWKGGAGLTLRQWQELELEDLKRQRHLWPSIGLAVEQTPEGDKILGAVVLSFESVPDTGVTYWEVSKRVGCLATLHNYVYDNVILEEPLKAHECLIDFIAVSPDARGKGVGAALMGWAQETGVRILGETEREAVAAHGPLMSLWVAADNAVAVKLYQKCGYQVVYKTNDSFCSCLMSRLFKSFLGHPVWHKMSKQLPVPEPAAFKQPEVMTMPAPICITACAGQAVLAVSQAEPQLPVSTMAAAAGCSACQGAVMADCCCTIPAHNAVPAMLPLPANEPGEGDGKTAPPAPVVPLSKLPSLSHMMSAAAQQAASDSNCSSSLGDSSSNRCAAPQLALARTVSNSAAAAAAVHMVRLASQGREPALVGTLAGPVLAGV
ncbi:hypothetical protein N2152v2_001355 [Parachlorella kessleri]